MAKVNDLDNHIKELYEYIGKLETQRSDLLEACKYTIEKMRGIKGRAFPILPIIKAIAKAEQ